MAVDAKDAFHRAGDPGPVAAFKENAATLGFVVPKEISGISEILMEHARRHDGQISEARAGEIGLSHVASLNLTGKALEQEKERRDERFSYAVLLALLDDLDVQIAALEDQIKDYDKQIAAVEWLIENHKIIDPNDPDHRELLRLAGVPEDEWGTVTVKELKERLEKLKAAKNEANEQLANKRTERDYFALKKDEYDAKKAADPNFDKDGAIEKEISSKLDDKFADFMDSKPVAINEEVVWFKAASKDLEVFSGHQDYFNKIRDLVSNLDKSTIVELLESPDGLSDNTIDALKVDKFFGTYERMQGRKDDPRYSEMLRTKLVAKLDDRTKTLLRSMEQTPKDVLQAINEVDQIASAEVKIAPVS